MLLPSSFAGLFTGPVWRQEAAVQLLVAAVTATSASGTSSSSSNRQKVLTGLLEWARDVIQVALRDFSQGGYELLLCVCVSVPAVCVHCQSHGLCV